MEKLKSNGGAPQWRMVASISVRNHHDEKGKKHKIIPCDQNSDRMKPPVADADSLDCGRTLQGWDKLIIPLKFPDQKMSVAPLSSLMRAGWLRASSTTLVVMMTRSL